MRRAIGGLIAALPLALGVAVAHADQGPWGDGGGQNVNGVPVIGTVVSTDPTAGTFVANAFVGNPGGDDGSDQGDSGGGSGSGSGTDSGSGSGSKVQGDFAADDDMTGPAPATTQVTITTNSSTTISVNGSPGTVSGMTAGDHFIAFFTGSPTDTIQTLVLNPALAVFDHTPEAQQQVYAFVGTVTGTDPTNGTMTITVTDAFPSGLAGAGSSVTLTVSSDTLILGGPSGTGFGGTLSTVGTGDIVAGGLLAPQGDTLAQVEALPLRVLLDLPAPTGSNVSAATRTKAKNRALKEALRLLGVKNAKTKRHNKHHKHHRHHARKHAKKG